MQLFRKNLRKSRRVQSNLGVLSVHVGSLDKLGETIENSLDKASKTCKNSEQWSRVVSTAGRIFILPDLISYST